MMNDWYHDGWGSGTWVAMALMMLAFWGVIAVLVVHALRTLDERLARGEIDAAESTDRREPLDSA